MPVTPLQEPHNEGSILIDLDILYTRPLGIVTVCRGSYKIIAQGAREFQETTAVLRRRCRMKVIILFFLPHLSASAPSSALPLGGVLQLSGFTRARLAENELHHQLWIIQNKLLKMRLIIVVQGTRLPPSWT